MTQKGRFKKSNQDDFDLDSYIEEQAQGNPKQQSHIINEDQHETSFWKNAVLGAALACTAFLWYHDWSPVQAYESVFGADEVAVVAQGQSGNRIVIDIPEIEIPEINIPEQREVERVIREEIERAAATLPSVTDYLLQLKELGLLEDGKLSAFQARQLHQGGVPISYVQEIDNAGYLDDLNFVAITEFYKNNIPLDYLNQFEEAGYLNRLNFVSISEFYKNDVSMEYLDKLDKAGYLDDLSFVYITEYYKAGVTTDFLDQLKANGLYEDLSFIDVVEMYKDENN